ncbi:MAG: hypothetical protein IKJ60_03180 [Ruminococcus sp.]|nr:hypothetical protein [Ruminococcus sp.]
MHSKLQKIRESVLECSEKHAIVPLSPLPATTQMHNATCIKIIGTGITVELPENASAETITAILRGIR